jgi:hypothetical protein
MIPSGNGLCLHNENKDYPDVHTTGLLSWLGINADMPREQYSIIEVQAI